MGPFFVGLFQWPLPLSVIWRLFLRAQWMKWMKSKRKKAAFTALVDWYTTMIRWPIAVSCRIRRPTSVARLVATSLVSLAPDWPIWNNWFHPSAILLRNSAPKRPQSPFLFVGLFQTASFSFNATPIDVRCHHFRLICTKLADLKQLVQSQRHFVAQFSTQTAAVAILVSSHFQMASFSFDSTPVSIFTGRISSKLVWLANFNPFPPIWLWNVTEFGTEIAALSVEPFLNQNWMIDNLFNFWPTLTDSLSTAIQMFPSSNQNWPFRQSGPIFLANSSWIRSSVEPFLNQNWMIGVEFLADLTNFRPILCQLPPKCLLHQIFKKTDVFANPDPFFMPIPVASGDVDVQLKPNQS